MKNVFRCRITLEPMFDPKRYNLYDLTLLFVMNFVFFLGYFGAANESTRKRVIFYTVGEYIFLAAASGLQVLYIRKLFSKSVAYNRV